MRILIDIGHPGHVHLFRIIYADLIKRGHKVKLITQDIKIVKDLLQFYEIPFKVIGNKKRSKIGKGISMLQRTLQIARYIWKEKFNLCISSTPSLMQAAFLARKPSIFMDDDDDAQEPFVVKFAHPFAKHIFSPKGVQRKSKKNIIYNGSHELAYLHPNNFKPNNEMLNSVIDKNEAYFVLRFVALQGHHDAGHKGIMLDQKRQIIDKLKQKGKYLSLPKSLSKKNLNHIAYRCLRKKFTLYCIMQKCS
jgi:predicted glycosyltransferase